VQESGDFIGAQHGFIAETWIVVDDELGEFKAGTGKYLKTYIPDFHLTSETTADGLCNADTQETDTRPPQQKNQDHNKQEKQEDTVSLLRTCHFTILKVRRQRVSSKK
jgi:hypothetical protein